MRPAILLSLILSLLLPLALAAAGRQEQPAAATPPEQERTAQAPSAATAGSFGLGVVDGLHLTGTPIRVEIDDYRLEISGLVVHPLSLSFSQITAMKAVRRNVVLICPGVFRDEGVWTGVPLRTLLERAGVEAGAASVTFWSVDGGYRQTLSLEKAMSDDVYLAYEFDGKIFDPRNGFPLRLVADGEPGSVWVKWLGKVEVRGQ